MGEMLALVQPSAAKTRYELRAGEEVLGRLERRRARGEVEVAGRRWTLERTGFFSRGVVGIDPATGEEAARLEKGSLRLADGRTLVWRRIGRKEGWELAAPDGSTRIGIRHHRGFLKHDGILDVDAGWLSREEALMLALFAAYTLIQTSEEEAAAS